MSAPQPINAVQTRVIRDTQGLFWPQLSTDGLNWFQFCAHPSQTELTAVGCCYIVADRTSRLPAQGEVVWRSKE